MIIPWGFRMMAVIRLRSPSSTPSSSSLRIDARLSRIRITTFSPLIVGIIETRMSTVRVPALTPIRPSCGLRRSAMSIFARIFRRDTVAACSSAGTKILLCRIPSIRYRTRVYFVFGSMWMSLALYRIASEMMAFVIRMIGGTFEEPINSLMFSGFSSSSMTMSISSIGSFSKMSSRPKSRGASCPATASSGDRSPYTFRSASRTSEGRARSGTTFSPVICSMPSLFTMSEGSAIAIVTCFPSSATGTIRFRSHRSRGRNLTTSGLIGTSRRSMRSTLRNRWNALTTADSEVAPRRVSVSLRISPGSRLFAASSRSSFRTVPERIRMFPATARFSSKRAA